MSEIKGWVYRDDIGHTAITSCTPRIHVHEVPPDAVGGETVVYEGVGMVGGRIGTLWGVPAALIGKQVRYLIWTEEN